MSGGSPSYLRAAEIAALLGLDVRTIRRWIADGTLPSVKIGGARLVAEADLLARLQPAPQPEPCTMDSAQCRGDKHELCS